MLSHHARIRCAQRGITPSFLAAILHHADIQRPAGSNCRLERVSQERARALNLDDRLSRYAVVLNESNAQIVTVMPLYRHGRMARRHI